MADNKKTIEIKGVVSGNSPSGPQGGDGNQSPTGDRDPADVLNDLFGNSSEIATSFFDDITSEFADMNPEELAKAQAEALAELDALMEETADSADAAADGLDKLAGGTDKLGKEQDDLADAFSLLSKDSADMVRKLTVLGQAAGAVSTNMARSTSSVLSLSTKFGKLGLVVGVAAAGILAFTLAIKAIRSTLERLTEDFQGFSPDVVLARVEGDLEKLFDNMRFAQESGPEVAEAIRAENEMAHAIRDLRREVIQLFLPLFKQLLGAGTFIINLITPAVEAVTEIRDNVLAYVEWVISKLPEKAQEFLRNLIAIRRNTEPEEEPLQDSLINSFTDQLLTDPAFKWDDLPPNQRPPRARD